MTDPEAMRAKQNAEEALKKAQVLKQRGTRLGEGWRKSQQDNNFRLMLRQLGQKTVGGNA